MHQKRVFVLKALFFEILKPKHLCNIFFQKPIALFDIV